MRVVDLVRGDQIRPHGREGFPGLHLIEGVATSLQTTGGAINEVQVAKDVIQRVFLFHVAGTLADNQRYLGFALEDSGRDVGKNHGVAIADNGVGRLLESVYGGRLVPGAVLHVINRHADDVGGFG